MAIDLSAIHIVGIHSHASLNCTVLNVYVVNDIAILLR